MLYVWLKIIYFLSILFDFIYLDILCVCMVKFIQKSFHFVYRVSHGTCSQLLDTVTFPNKLIKFN